MYVLSHPHAQWQTSHHTSHYAISMGIVGVQYQMSLEHMKKDVSLLILIVTCRRPSPSIQFGSMCDCHVSCPSPSPVECPSALWKVPCR